MVSVRAVSMTIGMPDSARIRRHTSMPSIPGSMRSNSTTSGRLSRNSAIAEDPLAQCTTSRPSLRRTIPSISDNARSSSTTSTRPFTPRSSQVWSVHAHANLVPSSHARISGLAMRPLPNAVLFDIDPTIDQLLFDPCAFGVEPEVLEALSELEVNVVHTVAVLLDTHDHPVVKQLGGALVEHKMMTGYHIELVVEDEHHISLMGKGRRSA